MCRPEKTLQFLMVHLAEGGSIYADFPEIAAYLGIMNVAVSKIKNGKY